MAAMNWIGVILVIVFGFVIAGAATALLSGRKPEWRARKRLVVASLIAPVLILLGTGIGIAMVWAQDANEMRDLAAAAMIVIGVQGALIAFVSGLTASFLADRALRSS
jgi:hypothetical protein